MKIKLVAFLCSLVSLMILSASLWAIPDFVGNVIGNSTPANYLTYWDQVTSENAAKWESVEGSRDRYNFNAAVSHYNFCQQNNIPYKFHTLVWGSQYPQWITNLSEADQRAEVEEWFREVASRFQPDMIDVVNEPLHAPAPFRNALGGSGSTGWDWVVWSFRLARELFPNSKLLLNDYGIISDGNAVTRYLQIIQALQNEGLIDGIGIQCHYFNVDNASASTLDQNLDRLGATGLPIYVSELDITGNDSTQLSRYQKAWPVFYNHPSVKGITVWGYLVGQTWVDGSGLVNGGNVGASERPAMGFIKPDLFPNPQPTDVPTPTAEPTPVITPEPPNPNDNVIVRARGTQGGEIIEVRSDGDIIETFTLTTAYQDLYTEAHGQIAVYFINDDNVDNGLDVQLDYIIFDGRTLEAEDQEVNTAVWQDSSCGGSFSDMMHCSGYILFADTGDGDNTPTPVITPTPTPIQGDADALIKVLPSQKSVLPDSSFTLSVSISVENTSVAAYGFDITYDTAYLDVDTDTVPDGAEAGVDGFLAAANPGTPGSISVTGFDVNGVGPGTDLDFLTIYLKAKSEIGTSDVSVIVNNLTNAATDALVGEVQGASVTVTESGTDCTLPGDGNNDGAVNIVDALLAAQSYVGDPPVGNQDCLDVNCDNAVTIVDALLIAQYYVGAIDSFPCL